MSEFMFGVRRGALNKRTVNKCHKIARVHGCAFVYANTPGTGLQSWFAGPNRGEPFDSALAKSVTDACISSGCWEVSQ